MTEVFRLALLNPNTDARHTEAMAEVARETLPTGCEVTAVSPERGPTSIESEADSVVAAAEVAALVRELPAHDAYLVACFGDPGWRRRRRPAPVVGIGEAASRRR
jgi:allantoin racemase